MKPSALLYRCSSYPTGQEDARTETLDAEQNRSPRTFNEERSPGDKVLSPANRCVGDEHGPRVLIEERSQSRQNRLHLALRHDREDDHLATGIVVHQMALMKTMMPFAGDTVDDRVPCSPDTVKQISDKFQVGSWMWKKILKLKA